MEEKMERFIKELKSMYPMAEISYEVISDYAIIYFKQGPLTSVDITVNPNYDMMEQCRGILEAVMTFGEQALPAEEKIQKTERTHGNNKQD